MQFNYKTTLFNKFKEQYPYFIHKLFHILYITLNTFWVNFLHVCDQYYRIHEILLQNVFTILQSPRKRILV